MAAHRGEQHMLDRRSVADRNGGEQLTTCAVGRDGPGCESTPVSRSQEHSALVRKSVALVATRSSQPHGHAPRGEHSTCSIDEALLTTIEESD